MIIDKCSRKEEIRTNLKSDLTDNGHFTEPQLLLDNNLLILTKCYREEECTQPNHAKKTVT